MNFLERRAIERATRLLSIPSSEEVLDFDIGSSSFCLLPKPFPPLSDAKRIDLVCTTQAIYVHASGISARWEWERFLELATEQIPPLGKVLTGRFTDGETFYVPLGASTRMLGALVSQMFDRWFSELTPDQQLERSEQLKIYKELAEKRRIRNERIRPLRTRRFPAKGHAIERSSGEEIGGGSVSFMDDALWFHNLEGNRVRAILPYEFLSDFVADRDDPATLRAQSSEPSVREVVVRPDSITDWLEALAAYTQD